MEDTVSQSGRSGVNVIEFDGNTVLCRVCGDRASGFHYGVHACEGCKGFFRRSIQQKIQYRPCVKNQHCLITRVNRNRCQYCRLKKCISIGMSRDAVRFGRVPKREKAKILEQMQKVNLQCYNVGSVEATDKKELMRRIIEAYESTCRFTSRKVAIFKDEAKRKGSYVCCPSKMACPLNPTPDMNHSSIDRWSLYSNGFMPAIHNVVTFAKLIPGFTDLNQEDQIMLLKTGTFEILLVQLSCLFDSKSSVMFFTNENIFIRKTHSPSPGAGYLLGSVFDFSDRVTSLNLTDSEMALFSAYILFSPDRPGLHNCCLVERMQSVISQLLKSEIAYNHPNHADLFEKLLAKIPEMRLLNTVHSEKLLGLDVPSSIAHCPPFFNSQSVPEAEDQSNLFWTTQQRPHCSPGVAVSAISSDFQNNPQFSTTFHPSPKGVVMGELEGDSDVTCEMHMHQLKTEKTPKEVMVNCHHVSPHSPPLSTPLGTFHRTPSTSWVSDHQLSPLVPADFDFMRLFSKCDRTDTLMMRLEDSDLHPSRQHYPTAKEATQKTTHIHPKKKVARVWSRDSVLRTVTAENVSNNQFYKEMLWKQEENDSVNSMDSNLKPAIRNVDGDKKLYSDFNINSRFLSCEGDSTCTSLSSDETKNRCRALLPSPTNPTTLNVGAGILSTKYAFPMPLWLNGSVESAPFFLPQRFSASNARLVGFDASVSLQNCPLIPEISTETTGAREMTNLGPSVFSSSLL